MYSTLKFLHVLSMFTAVSIFVGGELYGASIERSRDVRAIRGFYRSEKKLEPIAIGIVVLGAVLGLITAIKGHLDLTQTWLILGYVLFVTIMVFGMVYWGPRAKRILAAAEASGDEGPSPELAALIDQPKDRWFSVLDLALYATVILVMVKKPFS
jgi:uncharacterized membrane protein